MDYINLVVAAMVGGCFIFTIKKMFGSAAEIAAINKERDSGKAEVSGARDFESTRERLLERERAKSDAMDDIIDDIDDDLEGIAGRNLTDKERDDIRNNLGMKKEEW